MRQLPVSDRLHASTLDGRKYLATERPAELFDALLEAAESLGQVMIGQARSHFQMEIWHDREHCALLAAVNAAERGTQITSMLDLLGPAAAGETKSRDPWPVMYRLANELANSPRREDPESLSTTEPDALRASDAKGRNDAPSTMGVRSVGDLVDLELVPTLGADARIVLEPLLGKVSQLIDEGVFDSDPLVCQQLERDRDYLRAELYENPDHSDSAILLATSHRIIRVLGSTLSEPRESELVGRLVPQDVPDPRDPSGAIAAADALADVMSASGSDLGEISAQEWVAIRLGWYSFASKTVARHARESIKSHGAEFVNSSAGIAAVCQMLGVAGLPAVLIGAYFGLLICAWRRKNSN